MKLRLSFFQNENDAVPSAQPLLDIPYPHNATPVKIVYGKDIQWGESDTVFIEARLEDAAGQTINGRYKIQLGYKPDFEPITDRNGDFIDGRDNRLQLLRGAAGLSCLRLMWRPSASKKVQFNEIVRYRINVKPAELKEKALNCMVDELLHVSSTLPLSELEGLSQANLERKWTSGTASANVWDLSIKCEEIESLVRHLAPHLEWIRKNCATRLVRAFERRPLRSVRKFSRQSVRAISRLGERNDFARINTPVLRQSNDIAIHCAIKDFFHILRHDADAMLRRIGKAVNERSEEIRRIPRSDIWRTDDVKKEIQHLNKYSQKLTIIKEKCSMFLLGFYPWSQCKRKEVASIRLTDIPDVAAYKIVYFLISEFLKKRYFKESVLQGRLNVPEYDRIEDEGTPSVWQKNYSYIYESWSFYKLVEAFDAEGFIGLKSKYQSFIRKRVLNLCFGPSHNEPILASTASDDLWLDLYHGVSAYKSGEHTSNSFSEFSCYSSNENRTKLTPDFVIVFTNRHSKSHFHWIVLDAKSTRAIGQTEIDKRDRYLSDLRRYETEPPDQSWLVYSGEFNTPPGIEFTDISRNRPMYWDCNSGIMRWESQKLQPVGHIRANILSIKEGMNPFQDFARGQIATARRKLGLDNVTRPNVQHSFCRI